MSSVSGGKKYTGCEIYTWVASISASFKADYIIYTSKPDTITAKYGNKWSVLAGTEITNEKFSTLRTTEDGNGPATVELRADYKALGVPIGYASMRLYVGGNAAWDQAAG